MTEGEKYNGYRLSRRRKIDQETELVFGENRASGEYPYAVFIRKAGEPPVFINPVYCKSRGEACEAYFKRLDELAPPRNWDRER